MTYHRKLFGATLVLLGLLLGAGGLPQTSAQSTSNPQYPANSSGRVMASEFDNWTFQSQNGISAGAQTVTLNSCYIKVGTGYIQNYPISTNTPLLITDGANTETVTPTAVTQPTLVTGVSTISPYNCTFTATFANSHTSAGFYVSSGDGGLEEAINYAANIGGGVVTLDNSAVVTNAMLTAAVPYGSVLIEDLRAPWPVYWRPVQSVATVLAAPATLTATTVGFGLNGGNTTGGTYTGTSTYHVAISCVDAMGNEGQPSADFSGLTAGTGATNQIGFSAPAAQTGCVGYVPYISLASGTYALAYRVPVTPAVCALTKVETTIAACAITNANYNQVGSAAVVSALTLNTARLAVGVGGTSTTADYVGNSNGRQGYAYAPASNLEAQGVVHASLAFTGATAPATTVPAVLGTIQLPAGFMNYVGKTIRICGLFTEASAGSTSTVSEVEFLWDADGSNTTGAGVIIHGPRTTSTLPGSAADQWYFCQNLKTTVSGATATAGSIQAGAGFLSETSGANGTATAVGWGNAPTVGAAAVASLNLAGEARIDVTYLHTTGTDGAAPTLTDLTVEVVN